MFAKLALPLIAISAFATGVFSSPVSIPQGVSRRNHGHVSFNKWNNIQSLDGFDSFYGEDDFNGFNRGQTVVESQEVCHSVDVVIIQQRLAVLQELAKRIITENICEVETQVGFDRGVVEHFGKIYNSDGSFCTDDWHFSGSDLGQQTVVIKDNWNDQSSPRSVDSAYYTARNAYFINRSS
ncbi:hypothetical protein B0H14DRAFT_3421743 [Mycena olivaceomarginata]|nr:hypothetical protein B0H14DRAFT_3421743 [Mycena olivaceomarginata]